MKISLFELRELIKSTLFEELNKPVDHKKKIGKVVKYLNRPFRVRDIFSRNVQNVEEIFYVGVFDDDVNDNQIHYAPLEKIEKAPANKAKKPEGFDERNFLEKDIENFLRAPNEDGRPNILHVRELWQEISKELSWMEKYIFEHKWLNAPLAKTNEQIAEEVASKISVVKAAETRAFHKIEKIVMRDNEIDHDLAVIKQARAMHKADQPMVKIITFLRSELKNKEWMNQLDFLT